MAQVIRYSEMTVFNVSAAMIVNTVNCVGVMGAGLALEFRLRYPDMYDDYVSRCSHKLVTVGQPYVYRHDPSGTAILNFPTKRHWRHPSRLEWIELGLRYVVDHFGQWGVASV